MLETRLVCKKALTGRGLEEVLLHEPGHFLAQGVRPAVTSKRKWIPGSRRTLFSASAAAAEKLVNECVTPFKSSDVRLKLILSVPKKLARTAEAAPLTAPCPETYDGLGGVFTRGSQLGSATVLGLPVWPAS